MSPPATEIAIFPLQAGATIEDPSSPAGSIWKSILDTVAALDGFQQAYWGRQIENPTMLQIAFNWDSVEAHQKFMADPSYGPFLKHFGSLLDGSGSVYHANFTPHPPKDVFSSTSSAVTEMATMYFPITFSSDDQSSYTESCSKFIKIVTGADGCTGAAAGWVIEELEHTSVEGKAKAFMLVIGWGRVEEHMAFRETQAFKENIHFMRNGVKSMEMHHVKYQLH